MIMRFNTDLSCQGIYANGAELARKMGRDRDKDGNRVYTWPETEKMFVHSFDNPVLMRDNYLAGQIADTTTRETVFSMYESQIKNVEYDGVSIRFEDPKYGGVWSPSIDTLLVLRALRQMGLSGIRSAAEIGAGSGYIAKYVLEKAPGLESMLLIDLDKNAKLCWQDNIEDHRAEFMIGDATSGIIQGPFDLVVCNPPYIPRPGSVDDNPYEGLSLIAYLVQEAGRLLTPEGKLILNISSLGGRVAQPLIESSGLDYEIIDSMRVPLKVMNVLNNRSWMEYLLSTGLKREPERGYDYWHTLDIFKFTRRSE